MKQGPKATIRLPQAVALYIGAVLGAGILIVPGLAAQIAGPASLIDWGFLLLLVLPLSLCMAYLSQKYPVSGGVCYFVTKAFGKIPGAIAGWLFLMSVPIGAPVAALTGAGYLSAALDLSETSRITIACMVLIIALLLNYLGMNVAGRIQVAVIFGILTILCLTIIGAAPHLKWIYFSPFMPHGVMSIGRASTILFWCFIGWEAVSNLSEEFVHPERDVRRATLIAAIVMGGLYFMTAIAVIGTDSYKNQSQAALVNVAGETYGRLGTILTGIASLLICLATVMAYTGAASRLAYSLSENGLAPKWFGRRSPKYTTPLGGLLFLALCFICVMASYALRLISLTELIQLPNATFLLNYLSGCAAGVVLFKNERKKLIVSLISLLATAIMFLFVGWAIVYPIVIFLMIVIGKMWIEHKKIRINK
ncbi:APC family permease [Sporolactobacillus pectinivorans]|uniref:APC family permease n=1 Tax=Sporolactobacillus pectinivorans TaxID=1591408 RepID=UPI000C260D03|nr:amino acid permease [Sporolactobacillus pectinivorans]